MPWYPFINYLLDKCTLIFNAMTPADVIHRHLKILKYVLVKFRLDSNKSNFYTDTYLVEI